MVEPRRRNDVEERPSFQLFSQRARASGKVAYWREKVSGEARMLRSIATTDWGEPSSAHDYSLLRGESTVPAERSAMRDRCSR